MRHWHPRRREKLMFFEDYVEDLKTRSHTHKNKLQPPAFDFFLCARLAAQTMHRANFNKWKTSAARYCATAVFCSPSSSVNSGLFGRLFGKRELFCSSQLHLHTWGRQELFLQCWANSYVCWNGCWSKILELGVAGFVHYASRLTSNRFWCNWTLGALMLCLSTEASRLVSRCKNCKGLSCWKDWKWSLGRGRDQKTQSICRLWRKQVSLSSC